MPDNPTDSGEDPTPDQGRAGWDQVARQDQLHWTEGNTDRDESARPVGVDGTSQQESPPPGEDHDRNVNLDRGPRDDDGFADYQTGKDDDTPDSNWDQDDYRRTEFAGSLDGTNHPSSPPDIEGQPPLTLRPD